MNRIIFMFAFLMFNLSVMSQGTTGHLKFKGVPIEGTIYNFARQLEQKGYRIIESNSTYIALSGVFANTEGCKIVVSASTNGTVVNVVSVIFPNDDTWGSIYTRYTTMREYLSSKYGKPDVTETFSGYVPTDFWKFEAIKKDECEIHSDYTLANGTIILSMMKLDYGKVSVVLTYMNSSALDNMAQGILDDI